MLSVCMIWIYMAFTSYGMGMLVDCLFLKIWNYNMKTIIGKLMAGLVVVTVYAQIFSLFSGVGLVANVILLLGALISILWLRNRVKADYKSIIERPGKLLYGVIAFGMMAYGASRGMIHYDTSLYHAQSIHWIETYGIVKGLGNLHNRLAYNSAGFPLTAFYSFHELTGQSFHAVSGFLAYLLAIEAGKIGDAFHRRRLLLSDYGRLMAFYYLFVIFDEMISPASDYFMVLIAFYLLIRFMVLIENREKRPEGYGILCLLGVYLITVKLSAACILLLVIYPAFCFIKDKKVVTILQFVGVGLLIALPYFLRNIIISGWIVYPFTILDWCNVDWKIPKGIAQYDAKEIQVYGRGYTDVLQYDMPIVKWIKNWFVSQSGLDKLFILLAALSVILWMIHGIYWIRTVNRRKQKEEKKDISLWQRGMLLLVEGTCVVSFLFWLFTSPLFRYGCVYVWLSGVLVIAHIMESLCEKMTISGKSWLQRLMYIGIFLFGFYKILMLANEIQENYVNDYWLLQKDYDSFEVEAYEIEDEIFYKPKVGDQAGYAPFPSSPIEAHIQFRGDTLEEGFRIE